MADRSYVIYRKPSGEKVKETWEDGKKITTETIKKGSRGGTSKSRLRQQYISDKLQQIEDIEQEQTTTKPEIDEAMQTTTRKEENPVNPIPNKYGGLTYKAEPEKPVNPLLRPLVEPYRALKSALGFGSPVKDIVNSPAVKNFQNKIGGTRDIAEGFFGEPDVTGGGSPADSRYTKPLTYQIGNIAEIYTLGESSFGGPAVANLISESPKITKLTLKTLKILDKPGVKVAQKQLLGAYAFSTGVNMYKGYQEGGSPASAREGLKSLALINVFKGFTDSATTQLNANLNKNIRLFKGESDIVTRTRGREFESYATTPGTIYEFTPKGKLYSQKSFIDFSNIRGSTTTLKTESGLKSSTQKINAKIISSTEYYKDFSFVEQTSLNTNIQGLIGVRTKDFITIETPKGSINIGGGGSRINFFGEQYNPFTNKYFIKDFKGRSNFKYERINDDLLRVKGKSSTTTPEVTTQINFKEAIYNLKKPEQININPGPNKVITSNKPLTLESGKTDLIINKIISEKISAIPKTKVETPKPIMIKTTETKTMLESKPRINNEAETIQTIISPAQKTLIKPPKQRQREALLIYGGKTKLKEEKEYKTNQKIIPSQGLTKVKTKSKEAVLIPKGREALIGLSKEKQVQLPKQKTKSIIKMFPTNTIYSPGGYTPPITNFTPGINFNMPDFPKAKKGISLKFKAKKGFFSNIYTPSLEATAFNIKSSKKPDEGLFGYRSGLTLRPIRKSKTP